MSYLAHPLEPSFADLSKQEKMSLLTKISSYWIPSSTISRCNPSKCVGIWGRRPRNLARHVLTPNAAFTSSGSVGNDSEALPHLYMAQGNRILWVDLLALEYGQGKDVRYPTDVDSTNWNRVEELPKMMKELKQFVEADSRKPPSARIDSVHWCVNSHHIHEPTAQMWRALDGLSPKHLQITADGGACRIKALNLLQNQWSDLETLTIINISCLAYDLMKHSPDIFSQISSLTLDCCHGQYMIPPRVTRLKRVRILQNNACDLFIYGWDNNPLFADVLEVLEIESMHGLDFSMEWKPQDFREHLLKCKNLKEFRFAVGHHDGLDADLGVGSYIPPSVEKLELRFTRSLPFLHKFNDWINHASDPTWLPNLKSFKLTVDAKSRVCDFGKVIPWDEITRNAPRELSPEEFDREFEEQRSVLYDLLKTKRPSIELV